MTVVAFVFARAGSKGVARKNLRTVGGVPLLARAIRTAHEVPRVTKVIVSTDSEEMAQLAVDEGAHVPELRPAELADDRASELDAWRHALDWCTDHTGAPTFQTFVSVPPTAPLRIAEDLERCLDAFGEGGCDMVVTGVRAHRHPSFNMVKLAPTGLVELLDNSRTQHTRRQDTPVAYDLTTVAYVSTPEHIRVCTSVLDGRVRLVEVPRERAIDVDDELDLTFADFLAQRGRR